MYKAAKSYSVVVMVPSIGSMSHHGFPGHFCFLLFWVGKLLETGLREQRGPVCLLPQHIGIFPVHCPGLHFIWFCLHSSEDGGERVDLFF